MTIIKLKRAVIKEELVALTGDFKKAIVLNQMIYWSERRKDADKFLKEEIERINKYALLAGEPSETLNIDKLNSHGWIYKKAEELSEETMMNVKPKAMREYLSFLVQNGWLEERRNPEVKMDRTLQYRVNLLKIQIDLNRLGYALEGYSLPTVEKENTNFLKENTNFQKENRKGEKENRKGEKEKAIPEITTKITTKIKKEEEEKAKQVLPLHLSDDNLLEINNRVKNDYQHIHGNTLNNAIKKAMRKQAAGEIHTNYEEFLRACIEKAITEREAAKQQPERAYTRKSRSTRKEIVPEWAEEQQKQQEEQKNSSELTQEELEEQRRQLEIELLQYQK